VIWAEQQALGERGEFFFSLTLSVYSAQAKPLGFAVPPSKYRFAA
jgi:hypothetical protein